MKMLPIQPDPYVRAYAYHSYPLSILGARCEGEKKADIMILDDEEQKWIKKSKNVSIEQKANEVTLYGHKYADDMEASLYRVVREQDELIINVRYLQYTQPYGYISIALGDKCMFSFNNESAQRFQAGVFNKGEIFTHNHDEMNICQTSFSLGINYYLKLTKRQNKLYCFLSPDGETWELISNGLLSPQEAPQYIGICLFLGENQFYNWLYTNYITLYGRNVFDSEYFIDYFVTPEKDGNMYTIHSLLDFSKQNLSLLSKSNINLIGYLIANIDNNNYIEVSLLNEFYVEGSNAYQKKHHLHTSLIYGYDENYLYVLTQGFSIQKGKIKKSDVMKALENPLNEINVIALCPLDSYYKLNIDMMKQLILEYWNGTDSYNKIGFLLPKKEREINSIVALIYKPVYDDIGKRKLPEFLNVYGTNIYDIFLDNEVMLKYFLEDIRPAFTLQEHKKIMRDRIDFLHFKKFISDADFQLLLQQFEVIFQKSNALLGIVIKYNMTFWDKAIFKIKNLLKEISHLENEFYPELLKKIRTKPLS